MEPQMCSPESFLESRFAEPMRMHLLPPSLDWRSSAPGIFNILLYIQYIIYIIYILYIYNVQYITILPTHALSVKLPMIRELAMAEPNVEENGETPRKKVRRRVGPDFMQLAQKRKGKPEVIISSRLLFPQRCKQFTATILLGLSWD